MSARITRGSTVPPTNANLREWVDKISGAWTSPLRQAIRTGQLLIEAQKAIPPGQWLSFIANELPFKARTAQRLIAIASDTRITNATHASRLPPHWPTLYVLTRLSDGTFFWALEEEIIHPEMERAEAESLLREQKNEQGDTSDKANRARDASQLDQARKVYFAEFPKLSSRGRAHELELCFRALTSTFEEKIAARRAKLEAAEAAQISRAQMVAAIWQDEQRSGM